MNGWTDDRVEQLKKLWSDGFSASQIAVEMGGVTRNSIIGKIHRLGLKGRDKKPIRYQQKAVTPKPQPKRTTPFVPKPVLPAAPEPVDEETESFVPPAIAACSLTELDSGTCRWPIGDPREPDFHFCGGPAAGKSPYCPDHAQVAFAPPSTTRRSLGPQAARGRR